MPVSVPYSNYAVNIAFDGPSSVHTGSQSYMRRILRTSLNRGPIRYGSQACWPAAINIGPRTLRANVSSEAPAAVQTLPEHMKGSTSGQGNGQGTIGIPAAHAVCVTCMKRELKTHCLNSDSIESHQARRPQQYLGRIGHTKSISTMLTLTFG